MCFTRSLFSRSSEGERERGGDVATGRRGDKEILSPSLPLSPSPRRPVAPSLCLSISAVSLSLSGNTSFQFQSQWAQRDLAHPGLGSLLQHCDDHRGHFFR